MGGVLFEVGGREGEVERGRRGGGGEITLGKTDQRRQSDIKCL